MSKITPKNLSYNTTLPPFLARLQSQNAPSQHSGRNEFQAARPRKPRDEDADREDEPVYFDEVSGETLTKGEWEDREKFRDGSTKVDERGGVVKDESVDGEGKEEGDGKEGKERKEEKVALIGASRKRKVGRVIGGDENHDDEGDVSTSAQGLKKVVNQATASLEKKKDGKDKSLESSTGDGKNQGKGPTAGKGGAKKGKKIKLSFGDDD